MTLLAPVLLLLVAANDAPQAPARYGVVPGDPPPASVEAPRLRMDTELTLPKDLQPSPKGDGSDAPADAAAFEAKTPPEEKPEEK